MHLNESKQMIFEFKNLGLRQECLKLLYLQL